MALSRRTAFAWLAGIPAVMFGTRAGGAQAAAPMSAGVPNVVYHLADAEKIDFVMGNIDNHFKGMGGPEKVHIALVVHGPALLGFKAGRANPELTRHVAKLAGQGVDLGACGNTLDAQKLAISDLLPGFSRINEGGVVRLARLQAEGYAYLRP
jgi:intracellular sulfur oxidation DsrE/DsrF family protein